MAVNSSHAISGPPPPYQSYPTRSISYPAQSPAGLGPGITQSPGYPPLDQNGHNPHTRYFVGNQTRRQEPPNTLRTSLMSPTSSQGAPSPGSMPRGLNRDDQIERLTTSFRRKNKKIGVFYNQPQKVKADCIVRRLNDLLSGGVCIVQGFEILPQTSDWLQRALSGGVDYFIFVGLPPPVVSTSAIPRHNYEEHITPAAYFDVQKYVQRVAEVVVIPTEGRSSRGSHYLSRFLHLEGDNMDKLAEDSLALFAAPRPRPFTGDSAYFSEVPKLIAIPKKPGKTLGLSIMTREMSPDSEFPRIVLIKSFSNDCVDDIKNKLGKYTHIQSYNGVFLDGMDIKSVTTTFQSMTSSTAYLTVRYIHPIQSATPPHERGQSTPICKPTAPRLDPHREELPIPLYILGDIYSHNKKLFDLLSNEDHSPVSSSSSSSLTTPLCESQVSFTADPSCPDGFQEEGSDAVHPLDSVSKGMHKRANSKRIHNRRLSESDELFSRALLSPQLYENVPPLTFDRALSFQGNGVTHPTVLARQSSHAPPTGSKRYILQLPHKNLDRRFTHIFFRRSGIYLITVGLGEMMGDPLIQFENLCYWLRQVQTYVGPEYVKRILIVGMHETNPGDGARLEKIESFILKLDHAIREADSKQQQIMEISRKMSIISFNLCAASESVHLLCQCVNSCMDVMIERIWCYENTGIYKTMFEPFTQLSNVAAKVSEIKAVVATTKDIEDCYNYSDPAFRETLANYSLACISTEGNYHLIRPAFLTELLCSLEMNSHNYMIHATNITALKKLPVLNAPFPKAQMETLVAQNREFRQITPDQQVAVLDWAEKLELIYSLGKHKDHKLYFVPFLASEVLGDQANYDWDADEAAMFLADDFTVLYAEMHIPSSYQFFYGLLAELLKDVVAEPNAQKGRCCINLGCKEAILPMKYIDERLHRHVFRVYLQYHPLQNIIEFRAKIVKQQLAFLKTVENKLKGALGNSKSYSGSSENFNEALSFALPAPNFSQKLLDSSLWALGEPVTYMGVDGGQDEEDFDEEEDGRERDLLKTKFMTPDMQREWASSAPEMKEIPSEQFLKWSKILSGNGDKWALVGSKLGLLSMEDIQFHTHNPDKGGNGKLVLCMWRDSDCSYKDLVAALRAEDIRLDTLATQIESHFAVDN